LGGVLVWAELHSLGWGSRATSLRFPLPHQLHKTAVAGRAAPAQILGASTPGGAGAEALSCLFGCAGAKKPAPGEEKGAYRPEQYRAIKEQSSHSRTCPCFMGICDVAR
jgi:hypothetical protein